MKNRYLAIVAASAFAVAGCGGGSSSKSSSSGGSTAAANQREATATAQQDTTGADQQDAAAKSSARSLVTEVESCFTDQGSYSACQKPSGTQLPIGSGGGQVEVSAVTDTGFTIVAHSQSGTSFKIVRSPSGTLDRTCDKAGTGGCQAGGTW